VILPTKLPPPSRNRELPATLPAMRRPVQKADEKVPGSFFPRLAPAIFWRGAGSRCEEIRMAPRKTRPPLSRRERQIMDIVFTRGEATAAEVAADLPDPPSYSAVRTLLRILEEKGHLKHREDGPRYVFAPTENRERASRAALRRVVETFFEGSLASTVAALVDAEAGKLSAEELKRLEAIVKAAKSKSR